MELNECEKIGLRNKMTNIKHYMNKRNTKTKNETNDGDVFAVTKEGKSFGDNKIQGNYKCDILEKNGRDSNHVGNLVGSLSLKKNGYKIDNGSLIRSQYNEIKGGEIKNELKCSNEGELFLETYKIISNLGEGAYGKVKLAFDIIKARHVALKIINKENLKKKNRTNKVHREVSLSSLLDHPNLCKLYRALETTEHYVLEMEYIQGVELFNYISEKKYLNENETRYIFQQLIDGINYLHQHNIIHRDLKPENIIIKNDGVVKIIDFGFACTYSYDSFLKTHCGSPYYASPEMISAKKYIGPEVDVWSLGIILYTMLHGYLPFEGKNMKDLYVNVLKGHFLIDKNVSFYLKNLLIKMIELDPQKRITLPEVFKHPWTNHLYKIYIDGQIDQIDNRIIIKLIEYDFDTVTLLNQLNYPYTIEKSFYRLINNKIVQGESIVNLGNILKADCPLYENEETNIKNVNFYKINFIKKIKRIIRCDFVRLISKIIDFVQDYGFKYKKEGGLIYLLLEGSDSLFIEINIEIISSYKSSVRVSLMAGRFCDFMIFANEFFNYISK